MTTPFGKLLFCVALICIVVQAWAEDDDPFGDPFGEDMSISAEGSEVVLDLSGELTYRPILLSHYADKKLSSLRFLSNKVEAEMDVSSSFGRTSFRAGFRAGADTDGDNNPVFDLGVDELYFNHKTNFLDLTVGRFGVEWSPMNVFKLSNLFNRAAAFAIDSETGPQPVNGLHAIMYLGPLSLEGVFVPLYEVPTGTSDMVDSLGLDLYPDDISIVFADAAPGLSLENPQVAARLGLGVPYFDAYLYYFHGFINQTLTTSSTDFQPPASVTLEIESVYEIVDSFGLTASLDILGLIINTEAILTLEAPIHIDEEVDLLIGPVTNTVLGHAPLVQWSAGFEWEVFSNVRLLFEYTDVHILDELSGVNEALLDGDRAFGILDFRLPIGLVEPSLTFGSLYDLAGHDFTAISVLGLDFQNGVTIEASGIYFDIIEANDNTSPMGTLLEGTLIISLSATYSF